MSVHRTYRAWSAEDDAALQELLEAGVGKSAGPHNRLCGRCRAKSAEISPYTPHL